MIGSTRHLRGHRHGTILIVTMFICFTVAGVVLVLCRNMRVEAVASANLAASVQASSVERGAEQYVLRSEEHTSELQSRVDLVCRLLLEKKKEKRSITFNIQNQ